MYFKVGMLAYKLDHTFKEYVLCFKDSSGLDILILTENRTVSLCFYFKSALSRLQQWKNVRILIKGELIFNKFL